MRKLFSCVFFLLLFSFASLSMANDERLMSVERLSGEASFFNIKVQDSGELNGEFEGWCADWSTLIEDGKVYDATFYSSYAVSLPANLLDKPENLDEVNWLLNHPVVGTSSPGGHGLYTSGDVQIAIWALLNKYYETSTAGPFSQLRVDELVELALLSGKDFFPHCREYIGFLLLPKDRVTGNPVQTTIVKIPRWRFPKCTIPESGILEE